MSKRRRAIVGYVTWFVATRLARRAVSRTLSGPGKDNGGKRSMMNRTKGAPGAVIDRAGAVVEAVRPIVQRAMNDPELHAALRQAFDTGREVTVKVKGTPPKKAAERLARDRKLQAKVESSANDLRSAVTNVVKEPEKKKGAVRRILTPLAVIGGTAAAVYVFLRKRGGGSQETPY